MKGGYATIYVLFGNPFYPIAVTVAGIGITTSKYDLTGTSILSNMGTLELWTAILPVNLSTADLFIPIYSGIISMLVYCTYTIKTGKKCLEDRSLLAGLFILGVWMIFISTSWSAGSYPGDVSYISSQSSIRYVMGLILLTEIFLFYILWRHGVPRTVLAGLAGIHATIRLLGLYLAWDFGDRTNQFNADYMLAVYPVLFMAGLLVIKNRVRRLWNRSLILFFMALIVFVSVPLLAEINDRFWLGGYNGIALDLDSYPDSDIAVTGDENSQHYLYVYPFSGQRFQHDVVAVMADQLTGSDGNLYFEKDNVNKKPDYIIWLCGLLEDCTESSAEFSKEMELFGYSPKKTYDQGAVLELPR